MYLAVAPDEELRQGDIFTDLPWLLFDPGNVLAGGAKTDLAVTGFDRPQPLGMLAEPSAGVLVSADCDAIRNGLLLVCRVRPITEREAGFYEKKPANQIETKVRLWKSIGVFYLAAKETLPDSFIEVSEIQLFPREFLLAYRRNRLVTLTEEARKHLREKVAHYLSRFGADEEYFLTQAEMEIARRNGWL